MDLSESTEGGKATFYHQNDRLEKIVVQHFGETGQKLTEYYFLKYQLSFVFEKELVYNRPIYQDSTRMEENNDDEVFDINQSKVMEQRSYFKNGKLLHQTNRQNYNAPMAEEEIRLRKELLELLEN